MATTLSHSRHIRPAWDSIAERFSNSRECLAAFVALEAAEVLSGVKPANLINIANRKRSCGRNLYEMWHQYGRELMDSGPLAAREMVDRGDSLLLLIYDPVSLASLLAPKRVAALLSREGYRNPTDLHDALNELQARLQKGAFPHEIGVFLGYPLKDVLGFMGKAKVAFTCQGPWKIYGDPTASLQLADECRQCRVTMARQLARCSNPVLYLQGISSITMASRNLQGALQRPHSIKLGTKNHRPYR